MDQKKQSRISNAQVVIFFTRPQAYRLAYPQRGAAIPRTQTETAMKKKKKLHEQQHKGD